MLTSFFKFDSRQEFCAGKLTSLNNEDYFKMGEE